VNNDDAAPGAISAGLPPLDYYRKEVLAMKQKLKHEQQQQQQQQ
jgi:hypothetical protein